MIPYRHGHRCLGYIFSCGTAVYVEKGLTFQAGIFCRHPLGNTTDLGPELFDNIGNCHLHDRVRISYMRAECLLQLFQ